MRHQLSITIDHQGSRRCDLQYPTFLAVDLVQFQVRMIIVVENKRGVDIQENVSCLQLDILFFLEFRIGRPQNQGRLLTGNELSEL
ncbi:MAG: hypothetical protein CMJ65_08260 [Planctomycetaceae bacterium]|nr:hypothetical protein [Planctomycetaceae bacterium]